MTCDARCWTPVRCPTCGNDLPPRDMARVFSGDPPVRWVIGHVVSVSHGPLDEILGPRLGYMHGWHHPPIPGMGASG